MFPQKYAVAEITGNAIKESVNAKKDTCESSRCQMKYKEKKKIKGPPSTITLCVISVIQKLRIFCGRDNFH